ncbi:MAG: hypothetical protein JXB39_01610 [Deltaproteobacteria bacterium]|nr:hypothetical protein [Deltaproteobacteria bacterium]
MTPPAAAPPPDHPLKGKRIEYLPRMFRLTAADALLAAAGAPAWVQRRRRVEAACERARRAIARAWRRTPPAEWPAVASTWDLSRPNREIVSYNRWYPVERNLPMTPEFRDFVDEDGRWRPLPLLDADWVLAAFPAEGAGADLLPGA